MNRNFVLSVFVATAASAAVAYADRANDPAARAVTFAVEDKHEHKEGDEHEHKEGEKHEDEHKGEKKDLGTQKIGSFKVQVTLIGEVKPGEESVFIIKPQGDGEPKAVRAWVGVESGKGSIKTKAEEEKEAEWHAHHQVSKPLPAKSMLWVELETSAGKAKGSFDLEKKDKK